MALTVRFFLFSSFKGNRLFLPFWWINKTENCITEIHQILYNNYKIIFFKQLLHGKLSDGGRVCNVVSTLYILRKLSLNLTLQVYFFSILLKDNPKNIQQFLASLLSNFSYKFHTLYNILTIDILVCLLHVYSFTSGKTQARFRRRSTHFVEPN